MRDELAALPGITLVELNGVRDYEVGVEVSEETLRRHGLSISDVATAINRYSQDLSGGTIKSRGGDILLRTKGRAYVARDFEKIPIISKSDGSTLFLRDMARIKDAFAEEDRFYRFNGKPTVRIEVFRMGKQNVLEVADAVYKYLEKARADLPEGISLDIWQDRSTYFKDRLDLMLRNGGGGLILVVVLLGLFPPGQGGSLGQPWHSHSLFGGHLGHAAPGRVAQHDDHVRLHPGAGHSGGRRHRGG